MSKILYTDSFEFPTDELAQAAYVSSDVDTEILVVSQTEQSTEDNLGDSSNSERRQSQSFTVPSGGWEITEVRWSFGTTVGSPTGDVTLRIETDDEDNPSGSLAHANLTKAITPSGDTENIWTFASSAFLAAGVYWIVLACDNQSTDVRWKILYKASTNPYADGKRRLSIDGGSTWITVGGGLHDATFKVYALIDNLQSYSEDTIKQQGSYSLKGVAVQTDSLNDTLTKTLTDYLDYSIMDKLIFQVRSSRTGENLQLQLHDVGGTTSSHTINIIEADVWQTETWDLTGISTADRDTIDEIIIKVINADAENIFYFDNLYSEVDIPMRVKVDNMEYATDEIIQAEYVRAGVGGLIDFDPTSNYDQAAIMTNSSAYSRCGQALTLAEGTIASIAFYLKKNNSPTGNAYAEIYNATGTIGTNAVPTGGVLATSIGVDVATIDTSFELVTFTFATPYEASAGNYVVMCHWENGDGTDNVSFGRDMTGANHPGNWADEHNSGWRGYADGEAIFYLYTLPLLQCYSEDTIKQQGSYSLKGIAPTGSLNDTLTRTVSCPIDLSVANKILFRIRASRTGHNFDLKIRDDSETWHTKEITIALADTWQTEVFDLTNIIGIERDVIDRIQVKIVNADAENIFYIDNIYGTVVAEHSSVWVGG